MCCKTKRIIPLLLVLFLILFSGTISVAKSKTMYTKKPYVVKHKGRKYIIPQYKKIKVKLKRHKTVIMFDQVMDFTNSNNNDDVTDNNPLINLVEDTEVPKAASPLKLYETRYKWMMPKTVKVRVGKIKKKIKTKKLTHKKPKATVKTLPYNTFMSYMSYRAITVTSSPQYKMQRNRAYTDPTTGVRMVDGRYCIAVGPKVATKIGTKLELIYKSGKRVPAIVGDQKGHTVDGYRHPDGSAIEFLVDNSALPRHARLMGNMTVLKEFKGRVVKIKVFKK